MSGVGAREGAFLGGRLVIWAPLAALRERRLIIETGRQLHTLVRAIPFQLAKDLHTRVPVAGLAGWELSAVGTAARGPDRRFTGQVDAVFAVSARFALEYQQWKPDLATLAADRTVSTGDPHPARHSSPASGDAVLIGYLVTSSGAHTAPVLR